MSLRPICKESCFRVTLQGLPNFLGRKIVEKNPVNAYDGNFTVEVLESGNVLEEFGSRSFKYELFVNPIGSKPISISAKENFADHEEGSTVFFSERGKPKEIFYVNGNKFHFPGQDGKKEIKGNITKERISGYGTSYGIDTVFVRLFDEVVDVDSWVKIIDVLRNPQSLKELEIEQSLMLMMCDLDLLLQANNLCLEEFKSIILS